MKIAYKLICAGGALLVPIAGLCFVAYDFGQAEKETLGKQAMQTATASMDGVDRVLSERYGDAQVFAAAPGLLDQSTWYKADSSIVVEMNNYVDFYGMYALTVLVDLDGKVVAVNTRDKDGHAIETTALWQRSFSSEQWFGDALKGSFAIAGARPGPGNEGTTGTVVVEAHETDLTMQPYGEKRMVLGFAAPVKGADGKPVGVWLNLMDLAAVQAILEAKYRAAETGGLKSAHFTMLNSKGKPVIDLDPTGLGTNPGTVASLAAAAELEAKTGVDAAVALGKGGWRIDAYGGSETLMEAVLALMPDEERVQYSAMTGQSLFYMGAEDLKHKILAIVEEEGAERASYALKLLQSEGELTIASTGKDPATGRLVTHTYRVAGPVMIFLTTTAIEVDEELLNRCLVLTVDEGRDQTRAIHERQRLGQTLEGLLEREERHRTRRMHKNAQRLLRPLLVVNPFAPELHFADHATRTRRDHMKYLTLIRAVALLHQHQRPVRATEHRGRRIEYIEATREDIEISTRLAHAALGQSLNELTAPTRRLLAAIESLVRARMERDGYARNEVRFTRREVREWTQWGATQLKVHFGVLEELEYVLVHRGRGPVFQYELAYAGEGQDGSPFLAGLESGRNWSDEMGDRSAQNGHRSDESDHRSDAGRVEVGPKSALVGSIERARNGIKQAAIVSNHLNGVKNASAEPAAKARRS